MSVPICHCLRYVQDSAGDNSLIISFLNVIKKNVTTRRKLKLNFNQMKSVNYHQKFNLTKEIRYH